MSGMMPLVAGQDGLARGQPPAACSGPLLRAVFVCQLELGQHRNVVGQPEGSALRSLGLGGSCKSHQGSGWWDRGAGPWEKGMCCIGKSCWQQGLLVSVSLTAARRALEGLFWGCSAPGDEGAENVFSSIPPRASTALAGEQGHCWGRRKDPLACGYRSPLPLACAQRSQCLARFCSRE